MNPGGISSLDRAQPGTSSGEEVRKAISASGGNDRTAARPRIAALDMTKGGLVVCMVVYHSLNYSTQRGLGFRYLAFLPPSFIIITGFLLSSVYLSRYSVRDWRLHSRLIVRGLKLFSLFTVLNVLVQLFVSHGLRGQMVGLATFCARWADTYISGNGRLAVFEVLLPISYLLLLSPILLVADRLHWLVTPILTMIAIGSLTILDCEGISWMNASLLSAGVLGMLLGRISVPRLNVLGTYWIGAMLVYAGYFTITQMRGETYWLQLLGAVLALAGLYGVSVRLGFDSWISARLERLGKYSLVAYVGQILILQVVSRWTGHPEPDSPGLIFLCLLTLVVTAAAVEVLHWLRARVRVVDATFEAVFA
jgi:peptidoglycan/LPS O-acetylase OafA/YrhL